MPSGKPIFWAEYDHLLVTYLPTMTIEEFTKSHLPHISTKAVGTRAKKLGIKPLPYKPTEAHKQKIATTLSREWTIEEDTYLITNIKRMSLNELSIVLNIDNTTIWRRLHQLGYVHDEKDTEEKHRKAVITNLAKPEVKAKLSAAALGRVLSEETKLKIGAALSGEGNGQYGRGMTEEEKEKWRIAYFARGVHKMREWLQTEEGQRILWANVAKRKTPEARTASSLRSSLLIQQGIIKTYNGTRSYLITKKGGRFTTKSSYETRYVKILENDESVISFVYEPFRIQYEFDGIKLWYIPDFLVQYVDREELVEVKPRRMLDWPKNVAKFEAGREAHVAFRVITEDDLE